LLLADCRDAPLNPLEWIVLTMNGEQLWVDVERR